MHNDLVFAPFPFRSTVGVFCSSRIVFLYFPPYYRANPTTQLLRLLPTAVCKWRIIRSGRREVPLFVGRVEAVPVSVKG